MSNEEILILADNRVGTYSQAIALAKYSGLKYKIIFLNYNFLKFIPNFLFSKSLIRINKKSKDEILQQNNSIKYIISAGRRSASIGLFLKKYLFKKFKISTKIIQIMRPEINIDNFDFVIIPKHDKPKYKNKTNLIISNSSLANVEIDRSNKIFKDYENDFINYKKPITSLLIGGDTKKTKFSVKSAKILIENAIDFNREIKGTLIILSSRRTSKEIIKLIESYQNKYFIFFNYFNIKNNNPYNNILFYSDYFIISGDSISMITECCSVGKNVFIYNDPKILSKKHVFFHNFLIENNYAKFFNKNSVKDKNFKPNKLNEAQKIAKIIFNNLS